MKMILIAAIARKGVIGRTKKLCPSCQGSALGRLDDPPWYPGSRPPCHECHGLLGVPCNDIPWSYPEDLKHFRDTTTGHAVIMGRRTWESLPAQHRPLKGRTNIVMTSRQKGVPLLEAVHDPIVVDGADWICSNLANAINVVAKGSDHDRAYIIGGAHLYAAAIPLADELDLTLIDRDYEGDVRFPGGEEFLDVASCWFDGPGTVVASLPTELWSPRGQPLEFDLVERRPGEHPDLTFTRWVRR